MIAEAVGNVDLLAGPARSNRLIRNAARTPSKKAARRKQVSEWPLRHLLELYRRFAEKWCPGAGSNHRHCDFQSSELI